MTWINRHFSNGSTVVFVHFAAIYNYLTIPWWPFLKIIIYLTFRMSSRKLFGSREEKNFSNSATIFNFQFDIFISTAFRYQILLVLFRNQAVKNPSSTNFSFLQIYYQNSIFIVLRACLSIYQIHMYYQSVFSFIVFHCEIYVGTVCPKLILGS